MHMKPNTDILKESIRVEIRVECGIVCRSPARPDLRDQYLSLLSLIKLRIPTLSCTHNIFSNYKCDLQKQPATSSGSFCQELSTE